MRISAQFMPGEIDEFTASLQKADEAGLPRAYLVDGQLLWPDVYIYMDRALRATERIALASGTTNPFTRHFTVTAGAHATLATLHPGRVVLGIGRGDNAVRTLGEQPVRTSEMRAIVEDIRELVAGRTVDYKGAEIGLGWSDGVDIPILMPATGPRNCRIAGAVADIVMIQVGVNAEAAKWAIDNIHRGAEEAGRDPNEIEVTMYCAMWISDDLDEARSQVRWAAACANNHLGSVARNVPDHGMPEPIMRLLNAEHHAYDWDAHLDPSAERAVYPPEVLDDFGFVGPPERILETLQALADVGVDEVAPCYFNGRLDDLDTIGRELIPKAQAMEKALV